MSKTYADDPSILQDEQLFRRLRLKHLVRDDLGRTIISSAAFRPTEMSVFIESLMVAAGRTPNDFLRSNPDDKLVCVRAGTCREHGQVVAGDPEPDEPAHGIVFGKKSPRIRKALRDAAAWVVPATPPPYEEISARKTVLGLNEAIEDGADNGI